MTNLIVKPASADKIFPYVQQEQGATVGFVGRGRKAQCHAGMEAHAETTGSRNSSLGQRGDYANMDRYSVAIEAPV
ncbi:MAG: hypothetical protein WBE74_00985 [Terracidiphilus sp.]